MSNMLRKSRTWIALLLSVILIVGCFPTGVIALEPPADTEMDSLDVSSSNAYDEIAATNDSNQDETTVKEIVSLRSENVKHFDMGDGTYQAVTYGYPVHRKDGTGKWQDIDNTLTLQRISTTATYKTNDSRVKFASEYASSASLLTLSENGYTIEMSFVSPSKGSVSAAKVNNSVSQRGALSESFSFKDNDELTAVNDTSSIKYENVVSGVDLEYVLHANDVKENIIVNKVCDHYAYTFGLKVNNLVAELNESGAVYLRDAVKGNIVYVIPMPYMYDSNGEFSYEVAYQLKEMKNGTYELTITADEKWINAAGRVFPVVIDPTISSRVIYTYDTYVNSIDATAKGTNYGFDPTLWISNPYRITFIKSEDMPTLPSSATITNASLKIAYYYYAGITGGMYITAHQMMKYWDETSTWNTLSNNGQNTVLGISPTKLSTTYLGAATSYPQWASIDITNAAKWWYYDGAPGNHENYGVALKYKSGNSSVILHSYDAMNGYTPYFTVTYTPKIQQGVYAISKQNSTSYVCCNTVSGGTYVTQQTFSSPPASQVNRYAMFKIIYRPDTDDYVLRDMVNNEVIIYANVRYNAPLSLKMKNTDDTEIPSEKAWKIVATNDGFYNISCKISGTTYYMCMPSSGYLELTTNANLSEAKWNFHQYTGATFRGWGKIGEWPEHIENGSSATIEAYIYSTVIGENRAWFSDTSVDNDVATATRESYSAQMTITPKYGGNTKIRIEANSGVEVFGYHYLMSGWDTGSFFIKNKYSSEYLTLLDGLSDSELRVTSLPNGGSKEYTLWNMVYWADGYYKIIQDVVGDCIYGNDPTSSNLKGKPWADSVWQEILWKFIPQSDGTVKIQSYYHEANNPNNYVSLDSTTAKNIRSLANTGDKQLWDIVPSRFVVRILYDQAFVDKNDSVGYMTVLDHVFGENSIDNSIEQALFDQLGIRFTLTFTSISTNTFDSYPYYMGCLESADGEVLCENHSSNSSSYTCSTTGQTTVFSDCLSGLHHKRWNIFDNNIPASSSYIPILFTGHIGCGVDTNKTSFTSDDKHVPADVAGYANYVGGTCIVVLSQGEVASTGDWSARFLLHEIIHIFNAPDNTQNYTDSEDPNYDPTQEYRMNCVMGHNRNSDTIKKELTICEYCKNIAKLYKYSFYNH